MADYYTQTSFAIYMAAAEAELLGEIVSLLKDLRNGFETAAEADAVYDATSAAFQTAFPKGGHGDPFFDLRALFDDPDYPCLGCEISSEPAPSRTGMVKVFVSGDQAEPNSIAALFRKACPSALPFRFGWAYTCSRHHLDAFGGGYVEVSAEGDVRLVDPDDPATR